MGFPLVMYLSRSKTVSIWPELGRTQEKAALERVTSSLNLSLLPKVDIAAEWKKQERQGPPVRESSGPWPPPDAEMIAVAIERALRARDEVGSMADYLSGNSSYRAYKLSGELRIDAGFEINPPRLPLEVHGVPARLRLTTTDTDISLMLAFENIAGIDFRDGRWSVWESGAMWLLRGASTDRGYPLVGLFTAGAAPTHTSFGIVYFVNPAEYEHASKHLPTDAQATIAAGVDHWPALVSMSEWR